MVTVHKLTHADNAVTERISALLNSLRQASVPLGQARLADLLSKEGFHLFVARTETGAIVGMLTLTSCSTLAGEKLWIEDVIVDETLRGQGAGRALLRKAVSYQFFCGVHNNLHSAAMRRHKSNLQSTRVALRQKWSRVPFLGLIYA